jgi:outer membrane protein OmpA-like peptidoglycan-associated protein
MTMTRTAEALPAPVASRTEAQHGDLDGARDDVEPTRHPGGRHRSLVSDAGAGAGDGPTGEGMVAPSAIRAAFQPFLGHDLSRVRIHADAETAHIASARRTRAFTSGNVIAFADGQYRPDTGWGRRLIGHELAHVAQQARRGSSPDAERRAWRAADEALLGRRVRPADLGGAASGSVQHGDAEPAPPPAGGSYATTTTSGLDRFARDKADLTKDHLASIDGLAFSIVMHVGLLLAGRATIKIVGHTDTTGTEKHNAGLGERRALAVKAALEQALTTNRADPTRIGSITTESAGERGPAIPTGDEVDEPRNRRVHVEVTIVATPPPQPAKPPDLRLRPDYPVPPAPGEGPVPGGRPAPSGGPSKPPGPWLREALTNDDALKQLPDWAREKAIKALEDIDEVAADKVIDSVPLDEKTKAAAKAAIKSILKLLKGGKFTPPQAPPRSPEFGPERPFPKAPGEKIFMLPEIKFNWP